MGIQRQEEEELYAPYRHKIYDKEKGEVLGRNLESWLLLIVFYVIFYSGLVILFAICMWVLSLTLDPRIPKYFREDDSIIGKNPGLGFRPMPEDVRSSLVWLQGKNINGNREWIASLDEFLDDYYTPGRKKKGQASVKKCNYNDWPRLGDVCAFDVNWWGNCSRPNKYNFHKNTPCIFLKLNKIYGWTPDFIKNREDFPKDMPTQLRDHISNIKNENMKLTVWLTCEGETPADVEYLGPVKYYPDIQGFPGYYYPYMNHEAYFAPLVAVHFENPQPGIVINVECKAWAKNIKHSRAERMGSVHFELLID